MERDEIRADAGLTGKIGLPIANLFLPAVSNVLHAQVRAARNLAALQAIEAIRMHMAITGAAPASLGDISCVPVPPNPATGQPFPYKLDSPAGVATLDVPPSAALPARYEGKHYVLKLRK